MSLRYVTTHQILLKTTNFSRFLLNNITENFSLKMRILMEYWLSYVCIKWFYGIQTLTIYFNSQDFFVFTSRTDLSQFLIRSISWAYFERIFKFEWNVQWNGSIAQSGWCLLFLISRFPAFPHFPTKFHSFIFLRSLRSFSYSQTSIHPSIHHRQHIFSHSIWSENYYQKKKKRSLISSASLS